MPRLPPDQLQALARESRRRRRDEERDPVEVVRSDAQQILGNWSQDQQLSVLAPARPFTPVSILEPIRKFWDLVPKLDLKDLSQACLRFFFDPLHRNMKKVRAKEMGCNTEMLTRSDHRSAAIKHLSDKSMRQILAEGGIAMVRRPGSNMRAVRCIDHMSYDESPQLVKTVDSQKSVRDQTPRVHDELVPVSQGLSEYSKLFLNYFGLKIPKTLTVNVTKVLSIKADWLHLYCHTNPINGRRTWIIVAGNIATCNKAMASNSRFSIGQSLLENDSCCMAETMFERKTRAVDTDRHPSNDAAEHILRDLRRLIGGANFFLWVWKCIAHKTFQSHAEATGEMKEELTGIVNIGLCEVTAGNAKDVRDCAHRWIRHMLRPVEGRPDVDTELRRRRSIRAFVAGDDAGVLRRLLLRLLPQGAWDTDEITVYIPDFSAIGSLDAYLDEVNVASQNITKALRGE